MSSTSTQRHGFSQLRSNLHLKLPVQREPSAASGSSLAMDSIQTILKETGPGTGGNGGRHHKGGEQINTLLTLGDAVGGYPYPLPPGPGAAAGAPPGYHHPPPSVPPICLPIHTAIFGYLSRTIPWECGGVSAVVGQVHGERRHEARIEAIEEASTPTDRP